MFNPVRALLARLGYRKFEPVKKFMRLDPETSRRIRENQPREYWDDLVPPSGTKES